MTMKNGNEWRRHVYHHIATEYHSAFDLFTHALVRTSTRICRRVAKRDDGNKNERNGREKTALPRTNTNT